MSHIRPSSPLLSSLLAFALVTGCNRHHPETFRTDTTDRGPIVEQVSATGDVEAIVSVNVGSQVSGTITKIYVDFNSIVKKDQVLCDLDPRLFKAALESAEANLASARANVVKAQAALDDSVRQEKRARELLAQQLDSQADVDTAMATREQNAAALVGMKASVLQAKANRDSAASNLVFTHITSPIDGIVISRAVDVGVTVAASMTVATLFTIANDLAKMQILANIDEADVGKVKAGLIAHFSVDAWPGQDFQGRIREVRQSPNTINNVVTYAAVIDAPNPDHKLMPGMTASIQIATARRDEVVRVPNAALRFKPAGGDYEKEKPAPGQGGPQREGTLRASESAGPDAGASAPLARSGNGNGDRAHHRHDRDGGTEGPAAPAPLAGIDLSQGVGSNSGNAGDGVKGRRGHVFELVDGKPVQKSVRLGLQDSSHTEVIEGLAENESVIVGEVGGSSASSGSNNLMGGMRPPSGGGRR